MGWVTEELRRGPWNVETQVGCGLLTAERSRLGPARRRTRPGEMGDRASPKHQAPFTYPSLRTGAKMPVLLLPLEALALPSLSHFPAPLFLGHGPLLPEAAPSPFH